MKIFKTAIAGVLVAMLAACATGPRVYTDADPATDFGRYQSFAFMEGAGKADDGDYKTLSGQRIEDAVTSALQARGYQLDIHNPDFLVNFNLATEEKIQRSAPVYVGGRHGYRNGMYVGWPGYVQPGYVDSYTQGTLNIDFVDRETNQMIWEGSAVGRVTTSMRDAPNAAIRSAVASIFNKYPYVAGRSAPMTPAQ